MSEQIPEQPAAPQPEEAPAAEEIIFPRPDEEHADGLSDVGVLFVHGIGEQRRGETLVQFGAPVHDWLRRWFDGITLKWAAAGINWKDVRSWMQETGLEEKFGEPRMDEILLTLRNEIKNPRDDKVEGDAGKFQQLRERVGYRTVAGRVEFAEVALGESAGNGAPSHAYLDTVWVEADATVKESRWLMAESWWAETFAQPSFLDVVKWAGIVLPWVVGSHIATQTRRFMERWQKARLLRRRRRRLRRLKTLALRREWRQRCRELCARRRAGAGRAGWVQNYRKKRRRWKAGRQWVRNLPWMLVSLLYLPLGLVLSLVLLVLMFLVALLSLIPLASVSKFTAGVQQKLASYFGDSFILVASPVQAASITSQVRRDLQWLARHCRRVVLVAHSQGGAVAHLVVREGRPDRLAMLLTFGSGLRKLDEMGRLMRPRSWQRTNTYMILGCLLISAFGMLDFFTDFNVELGSGIFYGVALLLLVLFCIGWVWSSPGQWELNFWVAAIRRSGVEWRDYYASADPVPNGPTLGEDSPRVPARHRRINGDPNEMHNRLSLLTDHTSYMQNADCFVSDLVRAVGEMEGDKFSDVLAPDLKYRRQVRARRRWRVRVLAFARKVAWGCALLVVVAHFSEWQKVLGWGYRKLLAFLLALFPFYEGAAPAPQEKLDEWSLYLSFGSVGVILAGYYVVFQMWRLWDRKEAETFFSRPTQECGWKPRSIIVRFAENKDKRSAWRAEWRCVPFIATLLSLILIAMGIARPDVGAKYLGALWTPWVFAYTIGIFLNYFAPVSPSFSDRAVGEPHG